jgi:N-methylhydantoinase A
MRRLGVDVGGTFTDLAFVDGTGAVTIGKVLTTPADPGEAILAGSTALLADHGRSVADLDQVVHATTLVANTLIQRSGARVAFITTAGFIDSLAVGEENRFDLYDLFFRRPEPLVPRRLRFGLSERTVADGTRLRPVDRDEVEAIAATCRAAGIEAVAVCLLHSFRNPAAEEEVAARLAGALPGVPVTLSSAVAPEIREYHRASTAVANAYVQPRIDRYLARLETRLRAQGLAVPLVIMLSEGGLATVETARRTPIRMVESGPAAGAMAAVALARTLERRRVLAFDMGGTTAKLCMILDGEPVRGYTTEVARVHRFTRGSGLPLKVPSIELIEIGAGGGSIAWFEETGLLRVGPQSAEAEPGPACYGRGGAAPTVTDADLVLGYIDPAAFLGGRMRLDRRAAERALAATLGSRLGLGVEAAALAIHEVVNDNMASAARIHAVEHGLDPRRFTLVAFGGAGPVHAWRVAQLLKLSQVIVPVAAGVTSAVGLLVSPPAIELSRSLPGRFETLDWPAVDRLLAEMEGQGRALLEGLGVTADAVRVRRLVECRYVGQAYEVQTALPDGSLAAVGAAALAARFEARYEALYKRTLPGGRVEALTWRVQVQGPAPAERLRLADSRDADLVKQGERVAVFPGHGALSCAVLNRYGLRPGQAFPGPVLVEEDETTTVVGPGASVEVDQDRNLVITLLPG